MAKITRKFTDFQNAMKNAQTTRIWDIKLTLDNNSKIKISKDLIFRVPSIGGVPPVPAYAGHIPVALGGYTFNFAGKIDKMGEITLNFNEDIDGGVTKFVNEIRRAMYVSTEKGLDKVDNISTMLSSSLKFTIDVRMGDDTGNVTRTWKFFNCLPKPDAAPAGELNQDSAAVTNAVTFGYEYFTEGNGESSDVW